VTFDHLPPPGTPSYDLCVIGGGPAGLTVANEVARRRPRLRLCVLESGGRERSVFADELRDVDATGIRVKAHSRERVLGGASSTWAGLSAPLDGIDFEHRPWVPHSGWPLSREELLPYYAAAAERYRFAPLALFEPEAWRPDGERRWQRLEWKTFLRNETPQRFGEELADMFERDGVDLCLNATVTRLGGDAETGRATHAAVRTAAGAEGEIRARRFVVAAGGIENARLLLLSTFACPDGLGNERGQVGRYLMNHPKGTHGTLVPRRPLPSSLPFFGLGRGPHQGFLGLRLREEEQAARGLLNSYLRLLPVHAWADRPGVQALVGTVRRLRAGWREADAAMLPPDPMEVPDPDGEGEPAAGWPGWAAAAAAVARDHRSVRAFLAHHLRGEGGQPVTAFVLRNFMEMAPDPANRVTLGTRRDAFGTPLPAAHHDVGCLDRRSMTAVHEALREDLASGGWARLESGLDEGAEPWPLREDASHHLGTTRMGRDPSTSVVDGQGRVHSAPNVYVAGGSVFPTCGNANPTLTIVALAIRLAEHLSTDHSPRASPSASRSSSSASPC
jgi:choline dehydrogenase-like flavoprotein